MSNQGVGLLTYYENSYVYALQSAYPHQTFLPWLFRRVPHGFFKHRENRKLYIEWLAKKVGVEKLEDLTADHFAEHHGFPLYFILALFSFNIFILTFRHLCCFNSDIFLASCSSLSLFFRLVFVPVQWQSLCRHRLLRDYGGTPRNVLKSLTIDSDNEAVTNGKRPPKFWVCNFCLFVAFPSSLEFHLVFLIFLFLSFPLFCSHRLL